MSVLEYFADLDDDPYQLKNIVDTVPKSTLDQMLNRLHELWQCHAEDCA